MSWDEILAYHNHSELAWINKLARDAGASVDPFWWVEKLAADTGERFFSEYLLAIDPLELEYDDKDLCQCIKCRPNPQQDPTAESQTQAVSVPEPEGQTQAASVPETDGNTDAPAVEVVTAAAADTNATRPIAPARPPWYSAATQNQFLVPQQQPWIPGSPRM